VFAVLRNTLTDALIFFVLHIAGNPHRFIWDLIAAPFSCYTFVVSVQGNT